MAADALPLRTLLRAGQLLQLIIQPLDLCRGLRIGRRGRVYRQSQRFPCGPLALQGVDAAVAAGRHPVDRDEQLRQCAAGALGGGGDRAEPLNVLRQRAVDAAAKRCLTAQCLERCYLLIQGTLGLLAGCTQRQNLLP